MDKRVVELSRKFECVYIPIGGNRARWRKYIGGNRLAVQFLRPNGQELSRMSFRNLYVSGDAERLLKEMRSALVAVRGGQGAWEPVEGRELIGKTLPEWNPDEWLRGRAGVLSGLRGKVVLLTFFRMDKSGEATMPSVQALQAKHREKGLATVGMYNLYVIPSYFDKMGYRQKLSRKLDGWGVTFPIAMDLSKRTLDRYWLKSAPRSSWNVTFVLDRKGVIRSVHPGPELHPPAQNGKCGSRPAECNRHFAALEKAIQAALAN